MEKQTDTAVKQRILHTVKEHHLFGNTMHIVIGLSGGPDSMCLFDVLCDLAVEMDLRLYPVHVNHRLRPGAAEADQAFVEDLCAQRGLSCRSVVCDCQALAREEGMTSEEAGRKVRYAAFRRVADELVDGGIAREKVVIAVAQNANDQCETILFRLLRGSGIDGLAGMAYKRYDESGTAVIRPLLDVDRPAIEDYCVQRQLQPRIDQTNREPIYARNRIRLALLPYLTENYNRNIVETINRLGRLAAADKDYLWQQAEAAFQAAAPQAAAPQDAAPQGAASQVVLSVEKLRTLHPAVRSRVYRKLLDAVGLTEDVTAAHLAAMDELIRTQEPAASCNLPRGRLAVRQYGQLSVIATGGESGQGKAEEALPMLRLRVWRGEGGSVQTERWLQAGDIASAERKTEKATETAFFSRAALDAVYGAGAAERIALRHWQDGDYLQIRTGGQSGGAEGLHRKKLQDLFVDLKVPRRVRASLWLAAIGSEILWILPPGTKETGGLPKKGRFSGAYRVCRDSEESRISLEYFV